MPWGQVKLKGFHSSVLWQNFDRPDMIELFCYYFRIARIIAYINIDVVCTRVIVRKWKKAITSRVTWLRFQSLELFLSRKKKHESRVKGLIFIGLMGEYLMLC